jgi:hypothetical protein
LQRNQFGHSLVVGGAGVEHRGDDLEVDVRRVGVLVSQGCLGVPDRLRGGALTDPRRSRLRTGWGEAQEDVRMRRGQFGQQRAQRRGRTRRVAGDRDVVSGEPFLPCVGITGDRTNTGYCVEQIVV